MESKPTPGNWIVDSGVVVTERGGIRIAKMCRDESATSPTERDTNAHLVALAPELLKALNTLLDDYEDLRMANGWQFCGSSAIEGARIVLGKWHQAVNR